MSGQSTTPLAQLYQQMIDSGVLAPGKEPTRFSYPSMRVYVPTVTTYGSAIMAGENVRAELESSAQRNIEQSQHTQASRERSR